MNSSVFKNFTLADDLLSKALRRLATILPVSIKYEEN